MNYDPDNITETARAHCFYASLTNGKFTNAPTPKDVEMWANKALDTEEFESLETLQEHYGLCVLPMNETHARSVGLK